MTYRITRDMFVGRPIFARLQVIDHEHDEERGGIWVIAENDLGMMLKFYCEDGVPEVGTLLKLDIKYHYHSTEPMGFSSSEQERRIV